ncbi:hypothetical protein CERZMDRAFT_108685 [Cercospora zeae-maydis SCOH1-5]|uniref:NAD-dependent epimerase/dehydratase domain-containing protein n=1 Tax=Cercospora zeae-maydis SCOH1-5 TaxID=717836 RepID=A0A6A6FTM0_9PEZI|nr:hypothetical protein CERZMDRAFT_108685 [Cercospora zeae-maydis SCOH1-5]
MVVGGLGYIGSHTTLELLQETFNVIVVDDLSNSYINVLDRIKLLAKDYCQHRGLVTPTLRFHKLDYRTSAMKHVFNMYEACQSTIVGVIHFAAFKSVSESIEKPLAYYKNNIAGLIDLLEIVQLNGIKNFVFSSSATVYGGKANLGAPLREDDLVHFDEKYTDEDGSECVRANGITGITNPYGRTKYMAEAILADVAKSDPSMRITALRYFNPVGCHASGLLRENPRMKATNLFPVIAEAMTGVRPALDIYGSDWNTRDGTAVRDFIHVVDLAQGHIAAVAAANDPKRQESFRAFNLGTGCGMTVAECVSALEKASGKKVPAQMAPRRAGDVGSCVAATALAEKELGWRTQKSVDDCAVDLWNALSLVGKV